MKKINVLLADDHQIVIDGIKAFLEKESEIEVVGEAKDGNAVLLIMEEQPVDVAVLDINMPVLDGLETAKHILRNYPRTKILLLTMIGEANFIIQAMRLGIHGYIIKEKSKETLVGAIHCVFRGSTYWPPELIARISDPRALHQQDHEPVYLTEREREVLCLIGEGFIYKEIADQLNIAEVTVQTHCRNMKRKLDLNKVNQLVKYAIENKICDQVNLH